MEHLHPGRRFDADAAIADAIGFVTTLEGQSDASFVLQTLVTPNVEHSESGTIEVAIIGVMEASSPGAKSRVSSWSGTDQLD